jgi:hypothetical protein
MLGYMRDGTLMPVLCVGVHSQALWQRMRRLFYCIFAPDTISLRQNTNRCVFNDSHSPELRWSQSNSIT